MSLDGLDFELLWASLKGGNWALAAAALVILLVAVVRKYREKIPKIGPFLGTDGGGVLLAFVAATAAAVAAGLKSGSPLSWAMVLAGLKLAWLAMGGYAGLRKVMVPLALWLWYRFAPSSWRGMSPAEKVAAAEKAGDEAVKAAPAGGVAAIVGEAKLPAGATKRPLAAVAPDATRFTYCRTCKRRKPVGEKCLACGR